MLSALACHRNVHYDKVHVYLSCHVLCANMMHSRLYILVYCPTSLHKSCRYIIPSSCRPKYWSLKHHSLHCNLQVCTIIKFFPHTFFVGPFLMDLFNGQSLIPSMAALKSADLRDVDVCMRLMDRAMLPCFHNFTTFLRCFRDAPCCCCLFVNF